MLNSPGVCFPLQIGLRDQVFTLRWITIGFNAQLAIDQGCCGIGIGIDFVIIGIQGTDIGFQCAGQLCLRAEAQNMGRDISVIHAAHTKKEIAMAGQWGAIL